MEENPNPANEGRSGAIDERIIIARDKVSPTPNERTLKVWGILAPYLKSKEISMWDLICFCTGFLAKQIVFFDYLKEPVILIGKYVMNLHYLFPDIVDTLSPDEEKENGLLK